MEEEQIQQEHIKLKIIEFMLKNDLKGKTPEEILKEFYERN